MGGMGMGPQRMQTYDDSSRLGGGGGGQYDSSAAPMGMAMMQHQGGGGGSTQGMQQQGSGMGSAQGMQSAGGMGVGGMMQGMRGGRVPQQDAVSPGSKAPGGRSNVRCPWKLFVGQLPPEAAENDLMPLFAQFGAIMNLMVLRKPGQSASKGCAFVTYQSQDQAEAAIQALNGQATLPGDSRQKPILVHYAN